MSQKINYTYNVPVWNINGLELPFDAEDPKTWENYENAYRTFQKKAMKVPKDGGRSKGLQYEINAIRALFDDLFGTGTATKIFKGKPNQRRYYYEVHNQLIEFVTACRDESDKWARDYAESIDAATTH